MYYILFLFFSFSYLNAQAADVEWNANKKCIQIIDKLELLPSGYDLVALKSGGIVQVSSGPDGSIFVTNGKQEALSNGFYPSHVLNLNGSCNSSRVNQNGKEYLSTSLAELLANQTSSNMKKANEIIEACKDAPAFSGAVATTRSFYKKESKASSTTNRP